MTDNAYLIGLRLAGKKVVVIGGGTVAQRRVPVLLTHGAQVHVVTRAATPAVEALAGQTPGITLSLRDYRTGDLADAWFALAATNDPEVNAAVVGEAERRRIFCVRADAGREGTAVTPASFDYEGLLDRGIRNSSRCGVGDCSLTPTLWWPTAWPQPSCWRNCPPMSR